MMLTKSKICIWHQKANNWKQQLSRRKKKIVHPLVTVTHYKTIVILHLLNLIFKFFLLMWWTSNGDDAIENFCKFFVVSIELNFQSIRLDHMYECTHTKMHNFVFYHFVKFEYEIPAANKLMILFNELAN